MELQEVNCIMAAWDEYPPLHVMVAGYLGIGPKKYDSAEQFAAAVGAVKKGPTDG